MTHHPSFGTVLSWDPVGGTVYVPIGQVRDQGGPNLTRGDIDVSDQDSTLGYREFLPGLTDPGDYTFNLWFDPNNVNHVQGLGTGLLGDFDNDGCTLAAWEVDLNMCSGTAIWTFDGYVNSWSGTYNLEGSLEADLGVKISGKPTLAVT